MNLKTKFRVIKVTPPNPQTDPSNEYLDLELNNPDPAAINGWVPHTPQGQFTISIQDKAEQGKIKLWDKLTLTLSYGEDD